MSLDQSPTCLLSIRARRFFSFFLLNCCFAGVISAQQFNATLQPEAIPTLPQAIIGYWTIGGITFSCTEAPEVVEEWNKPSMKAMIQSYFGAQVFQFQSNDSLKVGDYRRLKYRIERDTLVIQSESREMIEISEDSLYAYYERMYLDSTLSEDALYHMVYTEEKSVVVNIASDSIVVKKTIVFSTDSSDPMMFLFSKYLEELEGKTLITLTTYRRYKLPDAKWEQLELAIPEDTMAAYYPNAEVMAKDLASANDQQICFLQRNSIDEYRTIWFSVDQGKNWQTRAIDFLAPHESVNNLVANGEYFVLNTNQGAYYTKDIGSQFGIADIDSRIRFAGADSTKLREIIMAIQEIPRGEFSIRNYDFSLKRILAFGENIDHKKGKYEYKIFSYDADKRDWQIYPFDGTGIPGFWPFDMELLDSVTYMFSQYGIHMTLDHGKTWHPKKTNDMSKSWSLKTQKTSNRFRKHQGNWFAGCASGVWMSKDGGLSWLNLNNTHLQKVGVISLTIMGNEVFVMDKKCSIWKAPLDELIRGAEKE